jgi:hypothetical protein
MADEQSDPPNKRRRPPTTIDVKATEVASETPATPEAPDAAPESLASEPAEGSPSPSSEAAQPGGWRDRMNWRLAAACGAGAAAMLLVLLALWGAGVFQSEDQVTPRLARLEQHVLALENRPQPPAADPRAVADLTARVAAAEQALGRLSGLDARLTKAEAAAIAPRAGQPDQALAARVTALENAAQKTSPPAASLAEVQALAARVAALEQAAKAAEAKLAVTAGADRAGRLAFLSTALRGAVERGEPFTQQLAAAKPLVTDAAALSALEPFAATGVPRNAALARDLAQLSGPMLSAAGKAPREGGILDRIQQNAERLVRIRPISETPGDDAATIVARAEAKASHGDIAGAVSELGALPPAVRAPAEPWIKKAQAQIAALAAAGKLADDALATLAKAAP